MVIPGCLHRFAIQAPQYQTLMQHLTEVQYRVKTSLVVLNAMRLIDYEHQFNKLGTAGHREKFLAFILKRLAAGSALNAKVAF